MAAVSILIVDDMPQNLLAMAALLCPLGYELVKAHSGEEALRAVAARDFATVLLDVRMPGMDGFAVATAIRAGTRNQHVPILFLTADDRSDEIERAFTLGAADYLQKPINATFLRGKVANFVELFRKEQRIHELLGHANQRAAQAEAEADRLRQADHALLRAVVENSGNGVIVTDQNGIVRTVNTAAQRQREIPQLQVGVDIHGLAETLLSLDETPLAFAATPLGRALHGSRVEGEHFKVRRPDGSMRVLTVAASPLYQPDGTHLGAVAITYDETERLVAENRLRVSQSWLSTTLASIGDGVIATDAAGVVTFLNPVASTLTLWALQEAPGHSLDEVFPIINETTGAVLESPVQKVLREGGIVDLANHTLLRRRDGTQIPIADSAAPIRDAQGRLHGVVLVFRDASEQRRAEAERARILADVNHAHREAETARKRAEHSEQEQRLARHEADRLRIVAEQANTAKDEFFATISHELRTPLTSILGWAQLLRAHPEMLVRGLETIERNAKAQAQLIEDMLDSVRIVAGKLNIHPTPFFVSASLKAAIDTARPLAAAKGLALETDVDPDVGTIIADAERFQQVIANLLTNALKFTPRDGLIRLSARRVDSMLEVVVEDTGIGIDAEFLPHVFDRYQQATPMRAKGLGLGLAIVRAIVELHGGNVTVESGGLGKGARFYVRIPIQAALLPSDTHADPANSLPQLLVGVDMLVVDDEPDAREIVAEILKQAGASVQTAASVDEALALLEVWHPQAIVSDIGMPAKDGYAFIRELRGTPRYKAERLPVIALTAFARGEDRRRALTAGFTSYISKPVEPSELAIVVANALGRSLQGIQAPG